MSGSGDGSPSDTCGCSVGNGSRCEAKEAVKEFTKSAVLAVNQLDNAAEKYRRVDTQNLILQLTYSSAAMIFVASVVVFILDYAIKFTAPFLPWQLDFVALFINEMLSLFVYITTGAVASVSVREILSPVITKPSLHTLVKLTNYHFRR